MRNTSKERLDAIFSEFIRLRDADDRGFIRCISCDKIVHWKQSDCGHYISRKHNSLRYDEINCNAQCVECNRMKDGNDKNYRIGLIKKYGIECVESIEIKKHSTCKMGKSEINTLVIQYKNKLSEIKKRNL